MSEDITAPDFNTVVDSRYGRLIVNRNDIYIGQAVIRYGEYSQQEFALFETLCRPGDIVVEVGANIGAHTIGLSQLVGAGGRIVAVEPQPIVFQTLCGNMALNSITNVDCLNLALGNETGHITVPPLDYRARGNFGGVSLGDETAGWRVEQRRLDDIFQYPRLRLLKIDVEGMEAAVLAGAGATIEKLRPLIYLENDRIEKSKALIEALFALDYELWWHVPPLFNPDNFRGDTENAYGNIVSINMLGVHKSVNTKIALTKVVNAEDHPMKNRKG